MWWAKYHAARKDYTDTKSLRLEASDDKPPNEEDATERDPTENKKVRRSADSTQEHWFLDAIDIIGDRFKEDSEDPAIDKIKLQLADLNSEG